MTLPLNLIPNNVSNIESSLAPNPIAGGQLQFIGDATSLIVTSSASDTGTINNRTEESLQATVPESINDLSYEERQNLQVFVQDETQPMATRNRLNELASTSPEAQAIFSQLNTIIPPETFSGSVSPQEKRKKAKMLATQFLKTLPLPPEIGKIQQILSTIQTVIRLVPVQPTKAQIAEHTDKNIEKVQQQEQEAFINEQNARVTESRNAFTFRDNIQSTQQYTDTLPPDPLPITVKYAVHIKRKQKKSFSFEIAQIQIDNEIYTDAPFGVCSITVDANDEAEAIEKITQTIRTTSFCTGNQPQTDFTYPGVDGINWNGIVW